jgi:subtilisin family serine protease
MHRWNPPLGAALLASLILAAPSAADPTPSRVLVRFAAGADAGDRAAARESVDGTLERRLGDAVPGLQLVDLPDDASPARAASELESRPGVLYAEPDAEMTPFRTVNDPLFAQQWSLNNTGQTVVVPGAPDADVDAPEAWDVTLGDPSIVVADIDTGGAWDHPDLAANVWTNPAETVNGADNDGNGLIDDVRGWDFLSNDNDPSDFDGHGTGTASLIAARGDNGQAIAGMAPNGRVMILRAGNTTIAVSAAVAAVGYAKAKGARVVNMSFGSTGESATLRDAILAAPNQLFVAAAGNESLDVDTTPVFPCATAAANLVCVGATTSSDTLAAFSNRGAATVDLAAPGQFIQNLDPAVRRLFSDDFSRSDFAAKWTTGGTNNTWARFQSSPGPPPDFVMNDSPGANYLPNTDSFSRRTGTFDTSGAVRECQIAFALTLGLGAGDALRVERASDAAFTTPVVAQSFPPATPNGTKIVSLPLGVPAHALRFRLITDATGNASGALIDDVNADCLKTIGNYDGTEVGLSSGTSESAPIVAGAAALLLGTSPTLTPAQVRQRLIDTTDHPAALAGTSVSGGRLNVARLLGLNPDAPPPAPAPPQPPVQPTPLPPLVKDTSAPRISLLQLSKTKFKPGKKTKVTFRLDEAAAVVITSERRVDGRKVAGKCVKPSKKSKKAKRCDRWVADKGSIARLFPAGKASLTFKGRLGDRTLTRGTHRLRIRATDGAGNGRNALPVSFILTR